VAVWFGGVAVVVGVVCGLSVPRSQCRLRTDLSFLRCVFTPFFSVRDCLYIQSMRTEFLLLLFPMSLHEAYSPPMERILFFLLRRLLCLIPSLFCDLLLLDDEWLLIAIPMPFMYPIFTRF